MKRKFAPWYTTQRWEKATPEQKDWYQKEFGFTPYNLIVSSKDGTLFSLGCYPTKIKLEDLPPTFVRARTRSLTGYFDAAKVVGAVYVPNLWINHLFKDDILSLSFSNPDLTEEEWVKGDLYLDGPDIVTGLAALECFSPLPSDKIESLHDAVISKVRTYLIKHPEEHDCIEEDKFLELLEREKAELRARIQ